MTAEELSLLGYPAEFAQATTPVITGGDLSALNAQPGSAPIQQGGLLMPPGTAAPIADPEAIGPDGQPLALPPNPGSANTFGGIPATEFTASPNNSTPTGMGFYQWAKDNYGLERGQQITVQEKLKLLELHNEYQKELLKQQDPEKRLKIQQLQHEISVAPMKDQNLQAQTAESQSKVIAGELAKQNAMDTATGQITELQSQRDNLTAIANHPALPSMVGAAGQYNPGLTDSQRNLKSYFDQIDGQKLIDGINKIKNESSVPGSPLNFRITQQEALAVKDSVNRLKRSQSPDDYRNAIASYSSILDRAIAAKQAQVARMPGVNQDLLKQFSYSPAAASGASVSGTASSAASVIKTIPGRGTFQSIGNGQWKQIQ